MVLVRILHRALSDAFGHWRSQTQTKHQLRSVTEKVVARLLHNQLWRSWAAWLDFVAEKHAWQDRVSAIMDHWMNK